MSLGQHGGEKLKRHVSCHQPDFVEEVPAVSLPAHLQVDRESGKEKKTAGTTQGLRQGGGD